MKKFSLTELLIFIVSAELTGALSALLSGSFSSLYQELSAPPFSPPAWLFPVVWTILYAVMGTSAYIVYRFEDAGDLRIPALGIYIAQLAVNFSWSIIFFRFRALTLAALTAVLLVILVGAMIVSFRRVSKLAAYMNIPYLMWSIFASYLAIGFRILN